MALRKVPIIPWPAYISCGIKVAVDGKVKLALFTPQPMETAEETFQVLRLILAAQAPKPGPIDWQSVPPEVQRHFSFQPETVDSPNRSQ